MNGLIAQKDKMSQTFVGGTRVPVTVVKAGPCVVTQIKTKEKDGYWAVQLGFGQKDEKRIKKPIKGHLKGALKDKKGPRFLGEVRFEKEPEYKVGDEIKVSDVFSAGDLVQVTGTGKGKGFAGVVKRWKFRGGPRTHGQSDRLRAPGSIGQGTDPGRVRKGKKMPGRMGSETTTVKNLQVVSIDEEKNELQLSGPVPGPRGGVLHVKKLGKGKLADLIEETPKAELSQEALEAQEKAKVEEGKDE